MKTHRHICGDTGNKNHFEFDKNLGCGHVFKHVFSKKHVCPKCKKKVTTVIANDKDVVKFNKIKDNTEG